MSVYVNQTNATPGSAFFAPIGGGGGTPSNWSSYPALSTITYSGAGGIANFTQVYAAIGMSTAQLFASTIVGNDVYAINTMSAIDMQTDNLFVSSINSAAYPPAAPIIGTTPVPEGCNSFVTATIPGITINSVIIGTLTASSTCQITTLTPGSNYFTIDFVPPSPAASRFNYVIYPAAT